MLSYRVQVLGLARVRHVLEQGHPSDHEIGLVVSFLKQLAGGGMPQNRLL
jgi:hypothetical protein